MTGGWRFALRGFDQPSTTGWGFELRPTGAPALVTGPAVTRQAILMLLSTVPGERVMRPTYGCPLHELVFAPNDETTAGIAMHHVRRSVQEWVPQAEILDVAAGPDPDDAAVLRIRLDYRHQPTGRDDVVEVGVPLDGDAR